MQTKTTITEALDLFHLDGAARQLAPRTKEHYKKKLGLFQRWCNSENLLYLQDVTSIQIRRFLAYMQEKESENCPGQVISDHYKHGVARALRTFLYFCFDEGLLETKPKIRMPRMAKRIMPALTDAEIKTVLAACNSDRDLTLVLFLLDTGARASEYSAMKVSDIDLTSGSVIVRNGKGRKDRIVYIGEKTKAHLARYFAERQAQPDEPAFAARFGEHLRRYGSVLLMKRLRQASGVKTLTNHALRRTFALNCLRNGMNIYILARLMGHADITVLIHYLPLLEADLRDAHARFGVVDQLS